MRRGVIYLATGKKKYVDEAVRSAGSVKRCSPGLEIAIFTDMADYAAQAGHGIFNEIMTVTSQVGLNRELLFIDKLQAMADTPFDRTLYLDADTHVFRDLNDIFRLLDRFQVVITNGHHRHLRNLVSRGRIADQKGRLRKVLPDTVPDSFGPVQGGFLLYNHADPEVRRWLGAVIERYRQDNFYDDQITFRATLWEFPQLSLFCLPEEYNFSGLGTFRRWKKSKFKIAVPHILHYTEHKKNPLPVITTIQPFANALPSSGYAGLKQLFAYFKNGMKTDHSD